VRIGAFAISVAIHVIAVLLYPVVVTNIRPGAPVFQPPTNTSPPQGAVVLRLIEIDETPDPEQPDDPEEIEEVETPRADAEAPIIEGIPVGELVPPGPTAAQLLRPTLLNALLWTDPPPEYYELTLDQREELVLAGRIVEWYDSIALATAAEERFTDWTFRDSNGGRWGVSEGKLHLGDLTLPLPLTFGTPVGKRDETNRRLWEIEELSRQSQRFLIQQSWSERSAAIRARRDRERARADTTRIR
jgi:hypothetical protein